MNIVEQITMHQLPSPEDSKHCCQLNLGIGVTKENRTVKHWLEPHFTYTEKRWSNISFSSRHQSLVISGSLLSTHAGKFAYTYPSHATVKRNSVPSLGEDRYGSGVCQVSYDAHTLIKDKRTFIEHETGQDLPT